jgi:hypothetical protein
MARSLYIGPGGTTFDEPVVMRCGDLSANAPSGLKDAQRYEAPMDFKGTVTTAAATVLGTGTLATFLFDATASNTNSNRCPKGCKIVLTYIEVVFTGTAWTVGTDIRISDTNASPVDFVTITAAAAIANQVAFGPGNVLGTATSGITWGLACNPSIGATLEKGLVLRATGTFTGGSAITAYVEGYFLKV